MSSAPPPTDFGQPPPQPYQAYLETSRAPLTGLWFTFPLFLFYHVGMWWLRRAERTGYLSAADIVIERGLSYLGAAAPFLSFVFVIFVFLIAQQASGEVWRWPRARVWIWMALESLVFALPIFLLSRATHYLVADLRPTWLAAVHENPDPPPAPPLPYPYPSYYIPPDSGGGIPSDVDYEGAPGASAPPAAPGGVKGPATPWTRTLADLALSCGAGVYEEFLFRMVLLGGLAWFFRWWTGSEVVFWRPVLVQALLFSAFHHLPGSPDTFTWEVFVFRTAAGVYFAYLYLERGFGIAAGAHAGYDIITVVAA